MANEKNILYGGDLGSDSEICENANSLGEFVLKRFQDGGDKVILVRPSLPRQNNRGTFTFFPSWLTGRRHNWPKINMCSAAIEVHSFGRTNERIIRNKARRCCWYLQ